MLVDKKYSCGTAKNTNVGLIVRIAFQINGSQRNFIDFQEMIAIKMKTSIIDMLLGTKRNVNPKQTIPKNILTPTCNNVGNCFNDSTVIKVKSPSKNEQIEYKNRRVILSMLIIPENNGRQVIRSIQNNTSRIGILTSLFKFIFFKKLFFMN
jgi:hypothetical protein